MSQPKIVVRRLPPTMTQETFIEQVSPLPDYTYISFSPPDKSLGVNAFSRVYMTFVSNDDVYRFTEQFDGYVFIDSKGNEYTAVVEFAPFQKVPKKKNRQDARQGTIENDPEYLKFLQNLENPEPEESLPSVDVVLEEIETKERDLKANFGCLKVTTPLLEYLKRKREEKKVIRERVKEDKRKKEEERRKRKDDERMRRRRDRDRPTEKDTKTTTSKDSAATAEQASTSKVLHDDPAIISSKIANEVKTEEDIYSKSSEARRGDYQGKGSSNSHKDKWDRPAGRRPEPDRRDKRSWRDREQDRYRYDQYEGKKGKDYGKSSARPSSRAAEQDGKPAQRSAQHSRKEQASPAPSSAALSVPAAAVATIAQAGQQSSAARTKSSEEVQTKSASTKPAPADASSTKPAPVAAPPTKSSPVDAPPTKPAQVAAPSTKPAPVETPSIKSAPAGAGSSKSASEASEASASAARVDGTDETRKKPRYKDRPERAIYNPAQRAAERRKKMEDAQGKD